MADFPERPTPRPAAREPWQLGMFRKGLKKQQRLAHLKKLLAGIQSSDRCLLLTCGDNNGAMNYYLRELGGSWSWADLEDVCLPEMVQLLLGEPVAHVAGGSVTVC